MLQFEIIIDSPTLFHEFSQKKPHTTEKKEKSSLTLNVVFFHNSFTEECIFFSKASLLLVWLSIYHFSLGEKW